MNKPQILFVEDDTAVGNLIATTLETQNYQFHRAKTGASALVDALSYRPDVMLLDLGLPDMDGLDVLKELSGLPQEGPVIIISARDRESEKVKALDMGADDYVVKPFGVPELLARIRTTLRRADRINLSQGEQKDRYQVKDLVVDTARHQVFVGSEEIHFTQNEFKILELLCLHAGKVLTYDFILKHVWGYPGSLWWSVRLSPDTSW